MLCLRLGANPNYTGTAQLTFRINSYIECRDTFERVHALYKRGDALMRRGTIFVLLFILVAAGVVGASYFLRSQPPLEVTIAVDPLAREWVQQAVNSLNEPVVNATRRVKFTILTVDDLDVWQQGQTQNWTTTNHPDAWLAASTLSAQYAQQNGLSLVNVQPSLARTVLVWGGYASRVAVVTANGANPLDWESVVAAADAVSWSNLPGGQADWRFIKLAFAQPSRKIGGLAVLLSGAGAFNQSTAFASNALNSGTFRNWLLPIVQSVPNFTTLGSDPAATMARGPSTVEIGIFPEAQWLLNLNGMLNNEPVQLSYPNYQFVLDFPMLRWQDTNTTEDQRAAVELLGNTLTSAAQQAKLVDYGLRPVSGEPEETTAPLFAAGIPYGIQLIPDYGQIVETPSRTDAQGLIQWVASNQ